MAEEYLIPPAGNEPTTGKTLSALRKSREGHGAMLSLFGQEYLPSSIMRQKRKQADGKLDEHAAERSYIDSLPARNKQGIEETMDGGIKGMHRMNSGSLTGALSKFPQEIGRTIVLFYTEQGDTVVDPFAGHNSRMELCVRAGRNYIGCDLSKDFMEFNWERAEELKEEYPNRKIKLHNCDSREQPIPDAVGDFTITSPPYWDIEWYGDEKEQLGKSDTYQDFLDGMREVMAENYRTLKPGAFSAWFINDFRRHGVMYFYHMDIRDIGIQVGFIGHDIMIVDLGRGLRDGFVNENVRCKVLPKRHEYCVVLKKPTGDEKKTVAKSAYNSHRSK